MGLTTLLIFLAGLLMGGLVTTVYMQHRVQKYTTECANIMLQHQADTTAQVIEAEERGRWNVTQTMDAMFAKFAASISTSEAERAQIILDQPVLDPPQELLMAYGVNSVQELPAALRAIWEKKTDGGEG